MTNEIDTSTQWPSNAIIVREDDPPPVVVNPESYVYVGTESEVGHRKFNRIGQPANLPPELIKDAVLGGCPLIPKDLFDAVGFTPEELRDFGPHDKRHKAPETFTAKVKKALFAYAATAADFSTDPVV